MGDLRDQADREFARSIIRDADRKAAQETQQAASANDVAEIARLAGKLSSAQRRELIAELEARTAGA